MKRTLLILLLSSQHIIRPSDAAISGTSLMNAREENSLEVTGPIKNVLAQTNGTAILPCRIPDSTVGTVTWVRRRDRQLLTVGSDTHSMDQRFVVRPTVTDWTLNIKNVKHEDAGLYECQVPTEPMQHNYVKLMVTEAYSLIPGGPDLHVKQGSSLRLECQLMAATEPPTFVFWYRQERMINYDAEPGVKVEATKNGSILLVKKTKLSHGGNYTCHPSNARASSVMIHVIEEEEKPAAMHSGGDRTNSSINLTSNILLILLVNFLVPIKQLQCIYTINYLATCFT